MKYYWGEAYFCIHEYIITVRVYVMNMTETHEHDYLQVQNTKKNNLNFATIHLRGIVYCNLVG